MVPTGSWFSRGLGKGHVLWDQHSMPNGWNRMEATLGTMRSRAWHQAGLSSLLTSATENMKWANALGSLGTSLSYLQSGDMSCRSQRGSEGSERWFTHEGDVARYAKLPTVAQNPLWEWYLTPSIT